MPTYNNAKKLLGNGSIDWASVGQTFRVLLASSSYVPDIDAHVFVSSVTNELSGGGYSRKDIVNRSIVIDTTTDRADYKGDNVTWTSLSVGAVAWVILFKLVTNDSDSLLIAAFDITGTNTNGLDFILRWDAQALNGTVFRVS